MNNEEKLDYTLKALYNTPKNGYMLKIIQAFTDNQQELTFDELKSIKSILEQHEFAVFQMQPKGVDYRGQITKQGENFVENDSFSHPGTPILGLPTIEAPRN